jgi:hypothetical protein
MSEWSDPKWILEEVKRKWAPGRILAEVLESIFTAEADELIDLTYKSIFPMRIPLKKPVRSEMNENYSAVAEWATLLRENSKKATGYGYELIEREMTHSLLGRNKLPSHAVVPTIGDAIKMLRKQREVDKFIGIASKIIAEWPELYKWAKKYPLKILRYSDDWDAISETLRWFSMHPACGLYIRQLDIRGVDTKFIENRMGILSELLDIILPDDAIDFTSGNNFELRYGLRKKPIRVSFRFLAQELFISGLSDLSIPLEQFAYLRPAVSRVFITENEINGICFPEISGSIVIFGLGYGVEILKAIKWLSTVAVYYWGDIDTHGFAILDLVRSFLPHCKSFLMTEAILHQTCDLWVREDKQYTGRLTRLTEDENRLFHSLQNNTWGSYIRMEQERLPYNIVQRGLDLLIKNDV